jgi:curved DNA-binding protein CbpA
MTRNAEFKRLGLSPDASWEDVKRAFRKLARMYHPDVAGPGSARKFAEITEAYMNLKELTSPGAGKISNQQPPRQEEAPPSTEVGRKESIFRKFWKKLFSRSKVEAENNADTDDLPPAKVRFIGGVISRAEAEIYGILSKRDEFVSRNRTEAVIRRLRSRHPAVVMLALRQVSISNMKDEISAAMIEHFKKNIPTSETLERVLDVFSNSPRREDLSRVMLSHLNRFPEADVMILLSRLKRWRMPREIFQPFLGHKSPTVIASALSCWPPESGAGENAELSGLLRKDEEVILIPLLRLLRHEKLPPWAGLRVEKLMKEHPSPAVRVWASAIVRDQNLS